MSVGSDNKRRIKDESFYVDYSVKNNLFSIYENDPDTIIVKMQLLHTGWNINQTYISKEAVEKSKHTIYNKPIIYTLNSTMPSLASDVEEHNTGFDDMRIAGQVPYNSTFEWDKDYMNRDILLCDGIIHKVYQPALLSILKNRDGEMKVSIEIVVTDGYFDNDDRLVVDSFRLRGICLLGMGIPEGIEGSNLKVMKYTKNDYNSKYIEFINKFEIPNDIRLNAKNNLVQKYNSGYSNKAVSLVKYIANNKTIDKEIIESLYHMFSSCNVSEYDLLGGKECEEWVSKIFASCNKNYKKEDNILGKNKDVKENVKDNKDNPEDEKDVKENAKEEELENAKDDEGASKDDKDVKENAKDNKDNPEDDEDDEDAKKNAKDKEVENARIKALEEQLAKQSKLLEKFTKAEEESKQKDYISKYSHCLSEEKIKEFLKSISDNTLDSMVTKVNQEVLDYALSLKDKVSDESQNYSNIYINDGLDYVDSDNRASLDNLEAIADRVILK